MKEELWKIIHVDTEQILADTQIVVRAIHIDKKQIDNRITAILMDWDIMPITISNWLI